MKSQESTKLLEQAIQSCEEELKSLAETLERQECLECVFNTSVIATQALEQFLLHVLTAGQLLFDMFLLRLTGPWLPDAQIANRS